jgi:predicted GH43/DUF377 family glycosyl hydrolase
MTFGTCSHLKFFQVFFLNKLRYPPFKLSLIKKTTIAISTILCIELSHAEEPLLDLETMKSDFVLESKQLNIPGYPLAFNPSIIRWKDSLLLSFRVIPDPKQSFNSLIGLVWLDENFNTISEPQILNTQQNPNVPSRAENARLIEINNHLFMVYDDNPNENITRGGFRVYTAEIVTKGNTFKLKKSQCLSNFEGANDLKREKNWTPFEFQNNLLLAYTINPHQIFWPIERTNRCINLMKTKSNISWEWGELSGGTPALQIDNDHYLGFFQSSKNIPTVQSKGKMSFHYFFGAYIFNNKPPFNITQISPNPIIGEGFYSPNNYKPYWKSVMAIFPCGYIHDNDYIWVVYGKYDHELWVSKLDKKALLESLVDASPSK